MGFFCKKKQPNTHVIPEWASEINGQYKEIVRIDDGKFVVFIGHDLELDWKTSETFDRELNDSEGRWKVIGDAESRVRLCYSRTPSFFPKRVRILLSMLQGEAVVAALNGHADSASRIFQEADTRLDDFIHQESRKIILYMSGLLVVFYLSALILTNLSGTAGSGCFEYSFLRIHEELLYAISLGGIGALVSIATKRSDIANVRFVTAHPIQVEVIFKTISGAVFSSVVLQMIHAGIIPVDHSNTYAIYVFSFSAGFAERLVPSLIDRHVAKES